MADYIYDEQGAAQGFRLGQFLYQMNGAPVGRVSAERVYRLDGEYVGEMFKSMVVEKPTGARRRLPPVSPPPAAPPPQATGSRIRAGNSFPDVFHRLVDKDLEERDPVASTTVDPDDTPWHSE